MPRTLSSTRTASRPPSAIRCLHLNSRLGETPCLRATNGALGGIIGHLQPAVRGEPRERRPAGQTVANRDRERALAAEVGERGGEEVLQVRKPRRHTFLPDDVALFCAVAVDLGLDLEQRRDPLQRLLAIAEPVLASTSNSFPAALRPAGN